jgi:molybdenum cofactor biosynthesis enzyme MoaA
VLVTESLPTAAGTGGSIDAPLRARLAANIRLRTESFGSIAYVPERDHFYALDREYRSVLQKLGTGEARPVRPADREMVTAMAAASICETEPPTPQRAFYGRSVLGAFPGGIPSIKAPMVVNCFTTAQCPLRCTYCHADDLMKSYREDENADWIDEVIRVAAATPAMVGVVTGGEPLASPGNAKRLLTALARDKAVVLDTSGVGDFGSLVPALRQHNAHVRFSLDSAHPSVNDRLRPINRRQVPLGTSSFRRAIEGVRLAVSEGVACSVQTVVTARNSDSGGLTELRDMLLDAGVRTWALHIVVPAGKAAQRPKGLLIGDDAVATLTRLVADTASQRLPIDIRVTSTHRQPNSTLLISAKGELAIQRRDGAGKKILRVGRVMARRRLLRQFRRHVDTAGHASRYLNGTLDLYPKNGTAELPATTGAV